VTVAAPPTAGSMTSEELLHRIVALLHERRGEDVVALDVRGLADYMDFLVVATGRSDRQNRAIADGVMRGLRGLKVRPLKRPGPEDGAWICLDFVDVVVHVFDGITRAHYDLEHLWGDAPRFPLPEHVPPTVG
jgi:ribosome-associated protein